MRTIIALEGQQLEALAEICRRDGISRAEAIRRAVDAYTGQRLGPEVRDAFGIWSDRGIDARQYEDALRGEWSREPE